MNIRGTGCSGGAFQFFETLQATDGYDVVETIAAQPWVEHGTVGMVGISYPGISQLFVAAQQPPHLAAIAPLSVIADTGRGTLRPGGIYNSGFAQRWATERQHDAEAAPASGQPWAKTRIEAGDQQCVTNQVLRGQAPDALQMIEDNPYWNDLAESLAPELFVDRIHVPVFLAGAWQDEQTGPYFANMLDDFTGTRKKWFTITNGQHTDSLDPAVLDRWIEFLQIYVAQVVPKRPPSAAGVAAAVGTNVWKQEVTLPPDRFADATSLEAARDVFESDPQLRILFENGAGGEPGLPYRAFRRRLRRLAATRHRRARVVLRRGRSVGRRCAVGYRRRANTPTTLRARNRRRLPGDDDSATWVPLPPWDWPAPAADNTLAYESAPLEQDTVMVGTGSVDLWLQADTDDVDVQVTLTEVRPDGNETLVQSGWQRASQRALSDQATLLRPLHTNTEADVAPLPGGEWSEVQVELFPFAHTFRAGSQIRVVVDTPGASRPRWKFDVLDEPAGTKVRVAHGGDHPSRVVLPIVNGVTVAPGLPPCPSLRGQPCRPFTAL